MGLCTKRDNSTNVLLFTNAFVLNGAAKISSPSRAFVCSYVPIALFNLWLSIL